VDPVGDLVEGLGRDPELSDEAVSLDVDVERVELMVHSLHLTHAAQPRAHVVGRLTQHLLHLVLRVDQHLQNISVTH